MTAPATFERLNVRIRRSKRSGRVVLGVVLAMSLVLGGVLLQGLRVALGSQRQDLVVRAFLALALLAGLDLFAILAIRRQHRMLDEAREEMESLVREVGAD